MSGILASVRRVCYTPSHMFRVGRPVKASALMQEEEAWTVEEIPGTIFVTIRNVPITSVGMEFQCASGSHTFTPEMIADLVASQEDPAIKPMRLKIGHDDPRFDGEPCLGKVMNMYVGDEGMTAYGDYVGVPAWLAEIMPFAYPSRSIEGAMEVQTVTGKTWMLAAHSLALLGVTWPGCSVLDDLPIIFSKAGPEGVEVKAGGATKMSIAAAQSSEDIRIAYYEHLENLGPDYYWWWIRAMYIAPAELIVEDGEGKLWRVPYTANEDSVEFGDASRVEIQYVDAKSVSASSVVAGMTLARGQKNTGMVYASRAESRPNKEGESMDLSVLCKQMGLPDGTPDAEVLAEAQRRLAASEGEPDPKPDEPKPEGEGEPKPEGQPDPLGQGDPNEDEPEAEGTLAVDAATLRQLQIDAAKGAAVHAERENEKRSQVVDAAIKAGKFPLSRRDHYLALMKADPEGTEKLIDGLATGLIPVEQKATGQSDLDQVAAAREERRQRFPELAAREAGSRRVTSDVG